MKQALDCMFDKMTPSAWPGGAPRTQNPGEKLVWCITFSAVVSYAAIYGSLSLQSARADLPIHATAAAVKGQWLFSLSPPVRGVVHSCGSTTPNKNSSNLRSELQDYKSFLETQGGVFKQVRLHLADKPVPFSTARSYAALGRTNRHSWKALGVYDGEHPSALVGSWTTVYDEGFEVDVGDNMRMMGFMKYSLDPACKRFPVDGDLEDASGNTKCYVTDARRTHMGWYIQRQNQGEPLSGCFYAERLDGPSGSDGASAFVVIDEAQTTHGVSSRSSTTASLPASQQQPVQTCQDLTYYISEEFINSHNASPTASWKAGSNPVFARVDAASLSKYIKGFGMKKVYRGGSGEFQADHSFVQSGSHSSTSEDPSADQLYACPCKKGEHRLDTRRKNNEPAIPVLSPLSVLEVGGGRTFLASIAPHDHKLSSLVGKEEEGFARLDRNAVEAIVHLQQPTGAHLQKSSDLHTVPVASLETSETELPANFSWSDPFSGGAFEDEVINQGPCGSCYAVAATYALQKRFEVAASKMLGREVKLFGIPSGDAGVASGSPTTSFLDLRVELGAKGNLSAQSILSCSFYNQGCDGGFPFLVGKHARDIGIPQENCMSYEATDSATCPFQSGLLANIKNESTSSSSARSLLETESQACISQARWYAGDYGYVGACYECNQCSGEKLIMSELYQNGPVAAALEAPPSLFSYHEGIYDVDSSEHRHARVCDMDNPECNGIMTGWEFTNHAVTILGWGEELSKKGGENAAPRKYWIVRNTWGPSWGEKGYVKIARGKNLGGIESQATWIDPDFTRGVGKKVAEKIEALKGSEAASG